MRRTKFRALGDPRVYKGAIRRRQNGNPGSEPFGTSIGSHTAVYRLDAFAAVMPPSPILAVTSYGPRCTPGLSDIECVRLLDGALPFQFNLRREVVSAPMRNRFCDRIQTAGSPGFQLCGGHDHGGKWSHDVAPGTALAPTSPVPMGITSLIDMIPRARVSTCDATVTVGVRGLAIAFTFDGGRAYVTNGGHFSDPNLGTLCGHRYGIGPSSTAKTSRCRECAYAADLVR